MMVFVICPAAMTSVASLCDQLREVDVSGCFQLTNATLRAFVTLSCIRPACDPLLLVMGGKPQK